MTTVPALNHPLTVRRPNWLQFVAAVLAVALVAIIAFTVGRTTADTTPAPARITPVQQTANSQADNRCVPHFC